MTSEFEKKGLVSVQIALLTHKMRIVFLQDYYELHKVTADLIKEEIEMIGFSAELLEMIENNQEDLLRNENMLSQASL